MHAEGGVAEILNTSAEADRPVNSSDKGGVPDPGGDVVRVSMEMCAAVCERREKQAPRQPHHPNDGVCAGRHPLGNFVSLQVCPFAFFFLINHLVFNAPPPPKALCDDWA